jgi:hypothetical protein
MDLHRRCNLGRGGGIAIRLCRRSGLLSVAQPSHAKNDIFSGVPSVVGKLASWARFSRAGRTMWARRNWTPRNWLGLGWLPSRRARRMKWVRCRSRVAPRTLLPCGCCSMMPSTWIMQYVGKPLTTVVYAQFVDGVQILAKLGDGLENILGHGWPEFRSRKVLTVGYVRIAFAVMFCALRTYPGAVAPRRRC